MTEHIFLIALVLGGMIALALLLQIFSDRRSDFFLGLVVLILDMELLLSWVAISGNQEAFARFPFSITLNYLVIPPALWVFCKHKTNPEFKWRSPYYLLFIPAAAEFILQLFSSAQLITLKDSSLWVVFSEYLPLVWLSLVIIGFWSDYIKTIRTEGVPRQKVLRETWPLFTLMLSITALNLLWLTFSFIGWENFKVIEYLILSLFFGLAFINFIQGRTFPNLPKKKAAFAHYNDRENLVKLHDTMQNKKRFLDPDLTLKALAAELGLTQRYVSYLINHYHGKNYKEYLNQFRVDAFIQKVASEQSNTKTLLALGMESGFNSKSTFNQVVKNHTGKTPSEFLQ